MHLAMHLKDSNTTQADFGARMDPPVSQGLVGQWCRGVTRITLQYALQIETETSGVVTCKDCADMFIDPVNRTASGTTEE